MRLLGARRPALTAPLALALALSVGSVACGGGGDDIIVDGSSTVTPVSEAVAEEYRPVAPEAEIAIGTSGTGGGFKKFCAGEIDISQASRPIKDEEREACAEAGVEFTELQIGLDGLAVVTNAGTDFVDCLTYEQLAEIFREGGAETWQDVDPAFPDVPISIFAPDTESGTYDFFVDEVLGDELQARTGHTVSADDNQLVQGIAGEANSFGFLGFAYYLENEDRLKAIAVQNEGECVLPTSETIQSGEYPLSRPLFLYVTDEALERPDVADFLRFYIDNAPALVDEIGYVAAPESVYDEALAKVAGA